MVITESELRELWRDGRNELPPFPPGTRFSPAAQDFLKTHRIAVRIEIPEIQGLDTRHKWDRPGEFPVVLSGPRPVCAVCGQPMPPSGKPEHLTQVDAGHYALKTDPRVRLRGQVDTLHAVAMLAAAQARGCRLPRLAAHLDTLAAYCREIQSAEYHGRPVQPLSVGGKSEDEIHAISHQPDRHLGLAHIVPGAEDHAILHWLNFLRTLARQAEVVAWEAYPPGAPDAPPGPGHGLAKALNRLSSAVYYLELLFKAGSLNWKLPG